MAYAYVQNYWTLVNSYRIETTTTSCTFDAQVLCDPTVQPLQSLLDEDPYVRMIMVTPLASVSPDSSMEMLENIFTEPENTRHLSPPTYEQEDAAIGAMLEEMMTSAVRLSVAAEDATSSTYYGTTESAAEEAFVAMLTSIMDLSRQHPVVVTTRLLTTTTAVVWVVPNHVL